MNMQILNDGATYGEQRTKINANFAAIEGIYIQGLTEGGVVDNIIPIQAAIDALAPEGGDLIIPNGVYAISQTIVISSSNIRLRGEGGGWNQDVGGQGGQAATTLKWIGTEFDGASVANGTVDSVSLNGNRINDNSTFFEDYEHQGMLIHYTGLDRSDLVMDNGAEYWDRKASPAPESVLLADVNKAGGTITVGGASVAAFNTTYTWVSDRQWANGDYYVAWSVTHTEWYIADTGFNSSVMDTTPDINVFPLTGWSNDVNFHYSASSMPAPYPDSFKDKPARVGEAGDAFTIEKPSVMVEVKSVYGDGATDQQIVGSGVQRIHFDCQLAHIGLRVITSSNGEYRDLSFIEPKTSAIYMGVKNIGDMNKPATVSQDPQFNDFENIASRNFTSGEWGSLLVATGVVSWGSNTSFNNFRDMRSWYKDGDAIVLGSSDANFFENCLSIRAGAGSGEGLKLLGTNRDVGTGDVPRGNRFTQFGTTGGGQILCYGTSGGVSDNPALDVYWKGPSHDNAFPWLNTDNGTPLPKTGYGANVFYDTDKGHSYEQKAIQMVVGATASSTDTARENVSGESLHVVNNSQNHMVLANLVGDKKWSVYIDNTSGDLKFLKTAGNGILEFTGKLSTKGNRKNIRAKVDGDIYFQENDDTILLTATTVITRAFLPASPANGDVYTVKALDATFAPSIGRSGNLIEGVASDYVMALNEAKTLQFYNGNWNFIG